MPQQKALERYIQELSEIDPEWEEKCAVTDYLTLKDPGKPAQKQTMGLAVSTLRGQENPEDEIISDANKSVFDWCKEGNVKKLDFLLTREGNVNTKDDQLWDVRAQALVCRYYGHYQTTSACVFLSPLKQVSLNDLIATVSHDSTSSIWEKESRECVATVDFSGCVPLTDICAWDDGRKSTCVSTTSMGVYHCILESYN
ncbi:PREDICTED: uncharacterized protein LOC107326992 [Acropora digitifera]|uniref:uncharacterized protein LOC107326992 n=1 Tax=Acropora digitifera TaxID=70779 RepID=UPI00077AF1D8|nr:PREDICTED: uncharacterized protein LOC107326992 [Acropora digitifera]